MVANFDLSEARRRLQNGDEAYAVGYLRRGVPRLLVSSELRLDALLKVQASMAGTKAGLGARDRRGLLRAKERCRAW